jgi:hypothetical protein
MKLFLLAAVNQQDPVWVYLVVLGGLAFIGFVLWLLNRFFPSTKRPHTFVGNALLRVEANFLPGREHVVEACEYESVEEDDQADPPEAGATDRSRQK